MCCAAFIAKYVLFIANLVFSLLGLAIVGLGIAFLVGIKDLQEILPASFIPISLIILGAVVFFIGFLACCGAIRESRCMLICKASLFLSPGVERITGRMQNWGLTDNSFVGLLLIAFIYLTVVILGSLDTLQETVDDLIVSAFNNNDLRPVFNVLELTFQCCGTVGSASYIAISQPLPPTCCANPGEAVTCIAENAFRGCGVMVGTWLETFSGAIGAVLIVIIIVQSVAVIFALFLSHSISNANKERRRVY